MRPPGGVPTPDARVANGTGTAANGRARRGRPARLSAGTAPGRRRHHGNVVFGWIAAVLLPPVGLLLGIRLLRTAHRDQGIAIIVVAAVIFVLAVISVLTDPAAHEI
jgi:hypothetical protein